MVKLTKNKCVFLDRDGVINVDKGYISRISNSRLMSILIPGRLQAYFFIPNMKKTAGRLSVMKLRLTPVGPVRARPAA